MGASTTSFGVFTATAGASFFIRSAFAFGASTTFFSCMFAFFSAGLAWIGFGRTALTSVGTSFLSIALPSFFWI